MILAATAVKFAIGEWISGKLVEGRFEGDEYAFREHRQLQLL